MIHHITGDIIHDNAILPTSPHTITSDIFENSSMIFQFCVVEIYIYQLAVIHAHINHHITECVADTGARKYVAILIQMAAANNVAIMT